MFLQVCVILFTGGECLTRYPPGTRCTTPGSGTPPPPGPGTPPGTRYTPQDQVHPRTRYTPRDQVHLPGPGTPPQTRYPPPPGPGTPPRDKGDTVYARAVRILLECNLVFLLMPSAVPHAP